MVETEMESKLVKYTDWMDNPESDEENWNNVFAKEKFDDGGKGHMLLQLQKSYKGDDRFKLDADDGFQVNPVKDKGLFGGKVQLPETMLGSLSKREQDVYREAIHGKRRRKSSDVAMPEQVEDEIETVKWEIDLNIEKEKAKAFGVLGKFVPQTEIFF